MAATRKASEIRAARKQLRAVTSVRRSVFYFMRTILTVLAVGALCILAFLSAARMSTTYILVNEGMSQRAECILKHASENDLASFFTVSCIESDANQRETSAAPYGNVTVSSYEYSLRILNMHLLRTLPFRIGLRASIVCISAERTVDGSLNPSNCWS